jgi:hypothetical protein
MKRLALTLTALVTGAVAAAVPAGAAFAAGGCWYSGSHWWCQNVYAAPVYSLSWDGTYYEVGKMYSTTSWFDCREDGNPWVGGPHPTRWEFTRADNGEWGWMKDTSIISETNPLPVCVPD